jgi:hypothetical protein
LLSLILQQPTASNSIIGGIAVSLTNRVLLSTLPEDT